MVYYPPVVETGPRARPGVVTTAANFLFATAALLAVYTVVSLTYLSAALDELDRASSTLSNASSVRAGLVGGLLFRVAFVVAYAVLGVGLLRGKQGARVTTWVLGGLGALCYGCALGGYGLVSVAANNLPSNSQFSSIEPTGIEYVSVASVAVGLAMLLLVIILLALPDANAYFRRAEIMMVQLPYPSLPYQDPYQQAPYQQAPYQQAPYQQQALPAEYTPPPPGNPFEPS